MSGNDTSAGSSFAPSDDSQQDSDRNTRSENKRPARSRSTGHDVPTADATSQRPSSAYQDLLNRSIEEVRSGLSTDFVDLPYPPSEIGGSKWTSVEKELLFRKLPANGLGNVNEVSRAIGTKSGLEIHRYLLELGKAVTDATKEDSFMMATYADMPSAHEITGECEAALNQVADHIEVLVSKQVAEAEREKYVDDWLIDEEVAESIEHRLKPLAEIGGAITPDIDIDNYPKRPQDASTEPLRTSSNAAEASLSPSATDHDVVLESDGDVETSSHPSANLLRPLAFIKLSRSLFMNNNNDPDSRFDHLMKLDPDSPGPSMHRSAFEDLYELTVGLVRRYVQASIFQTSTRLRADDDKRTAAVVSPRDVQTALTELGSHVTRDDWWRYWHKTVKRYGVECYSSSRDFEKEGRTEHHLGYRLTQDEIDQHLGLQTSSEPEAQIGSAGQTDKMSDIDSDDLTEVSVNDANKLEQQEEEPDLPNIPYERRQSPGTQAEEVRLEKLDRGASRTAENELRRMLGIDELGELTPTRSLTLEPMDEHNARWRDTVEYKAEWEQGLDPIKPEQFAAMDQLGVSGRKRRKITRERMAAGEFDGHSASSSEQSNPIESLGPGPTFDAERMRGICGNYSEEDSTTSMSGESSTQIDEESSEGSNVDSTAQTDDESEVQSSEDE